MKKIYFLLLAFCFFNGLSAQIVNIPDARFKKMLLKTPGIINNTGYFLDLQGKELKIDANNDGEIQENEALQVSYLSVHSDGVNGLIYSSEGISKFSNLETLICDGNRIPSLNLTTMTKLKTLICNNNQLTSLNLNGLVDLVSLNCSFNQLSALDLNGSTNLTDVNCETNYQLSFLNISDLANLKSLICSDTKLTSLDINSLVNLSSVICEDSQLTSLDLTNLINLETLNCNYNKISIINFGVLPKLKKLYCLSNALISFDLSALVNLEEFNCNYNKITSLNITDMAKLRGLSCAGNQLTSLKLNNLPNLVSLQCESNQLTALDLIGCPILEVLVCYNNQLTSLDISELTKLTSLDLENNVNLISLSLKNGSPINQLYNNLSNCPNLKYICVDEFKLKKVQDLINQLGYTNCQVNSYCTFVPGGDFYTVKGFTNFDENANGCDATDIVFPSLKFTITDGITSGWLISNNLGNYSISALSGTHTIVPVFEKPNYFNITPSRVNITFPTQASPIVQYFCVTANGNHTDLEVTLLPLNPAIPGFDAKYKIVYKNKGNAIKSGSVNLKFDDAILDYVVSSPNFYSQAVDNIAWNFSGLKPFESREIVFALNINRPTETPAVNNGDVLKFTTTITSEDTDETPKDNTFTLNQTVVGSFDPNDKTCLEGITITPALIGEYVHYMIRFENKGTYSAQNIVVKDLIDLSKFDILTLIPTSSSHSYTTKISDANKVEFIFENINLPFDDANNDGYIAFKIKTKPTLVVGDSFTNEASIFFDYNFPIITNKATSTFKTLGTKDFEFSNYFIVYPNPANEILNIVTTNEIEVKSIAVYNISGQLVLAFPNVKVISKIDVSNLKTGNYFIKINSDKGSSSMKFIKK
ncbi:T9SS type A sorting domain-containing protein [Flavobacterium rhamnosiphilum]|uniref:T9SS type A sorting domain-containing protein n=1 Tax=Flavobacterium rhamnosiphilum TaxID=2541724 RepID=A0A4R5F3K0_9FLAO|nr:T9SS type A sorting domain-containing protein [Flavobacterium rhamnosiphilum]TDE42013.1 T9SS type A sorting domain-containing protein [Flavobacterium rhamnosiphilum]